MKTSALYKSLPLAAIGSLGLLLTNAGQAAIVNSFSDTFVPGDFNDTSTYVTSYTITAADLTGFSASGTSKLALSISTKSDDNAGGAVSSISYDGAGMTLANDGVNTAQQGYQRTQASIWYLDNVTSDGEMSISFDAATEGFAIRLFALTDTVAGVQSVAERKQYSDGTAPSLTSTTSAFILYDVARNAFGTSFTNDSTFEDNEFAFGKRGDSMALWDEVGPGTYNPNVSGGNSNGGWVGASFEVVPEPSSFALLAGMFGLTWVMLRRR